MGVLPLERRRNNGNRRKGTPNKEAVRALNGFFIVGRTYSILPIGNGLTVFSDKENIHFAPNMVRYERGLMEVRFSDPKVSVYFEKVGNNWKVYRILELLE